ncbi:threonyl-tRNA synthetase, partial [mine drainage metagenome]
ALNRDWQISTIQVDFFMPPNFGLYYINADGKKEPVIMIHRAVYGSLERMMAIVIEGSTGKLPTWLSPHQVFVLPVNDSSLDYASQINRELVSMDVRSEVDASKESVSKKIRMLHDLRPSYILVVGSKEMEDRSVTVRGKDNKQEVMPFVAFREKIGREISERTV